MPGIVRQVLAFNNNAPGLTDNTSLIITNTPNPSDVIIFYCRAFESSPGTLTGVSGLGATWSKIVPTWVPAIPCIDWYIGVNPSTSGPITVTRSVTKNVNMAAWHLAGVSANTAITQIRNGSGALSQVGTPVNAQNGQIVLQTLGSGATSGMSAPNPAVPASGWTHTSINADAIRGSFASGYRIPPETAPTQHNATVTVGANQINSVENLVVGVPGLALSKSDLLFQDLAQSWAPGSIADMEYKRLCATLGLTNPQPLTLYDLYFLAGEKPRIPVRSGGAPVGETRRNGARNPKLGIDLSDWQRSLGTGGAATGTRMTDGNLNVGYMIVNTYMRSTWTTAPTGLSSTGFLVGASGNDGLVVTQPGKPFTLSAYVRSSHADRGMVILCTFHDNAGTNVGTSPNSPTVLVGGAAWKRLAMTTVAPAAATRAFCRIYSQSGTDWLVGETVDATCIMTEAAPNARPYIDGDIPDTPGFQYDWVAAANASMSTLTQ